ncbi:phage terminase large subunit [Cyanobium sp. ATX 6F1]|uniref:phage terminase large subunit n=1 Tax=Cyanobium sp. ATX 6F1 TaxID=2823702 RepID=UPI0020CBBA6F|nr:phage terminase large subunit [Cyanobium sp. ATX 6F1]MCP9917330.1 phage terminase large subunit [Cyanobium sp. ATX 6F1]
MDLAELEAQLAERPAGTFKEFVSRVAPQVAFYRHVELLADVLQRVADGGHRRVLILLPPRSGKSLLSSRLLSAYYLRRHPGLWVGMSSYGADLAEGFSREARGFYTADGGTLDRSSKSVGQWVTGAGGGCWATGVGGATTGRGFSLGIVDDPTKDAQQADSPTYRERMVSWWESTFATRAEPGAALVVVQTRWHISDLAGHLLAKEAEAPEGWHVVNLPAIAEQQNEPTAWSQEPDFREPGEPLCPERFDSDALAKIRAGMSARWWEALYQQRPSIAAGSVFVREWFKFYEPPEVPRNFVRLVASIDCTFKGTDGSDFVSLQVWGQHSTGIWLLDNDTRRLGFTGTLSAITASHQRWHWGELLIEDAANGPAVIDTLIRQAQGFSVRAVRPLGGKVARANAAAVQLEQGQVWFPRSAPWLQGFVDELLSFPSGAHDDQVDAMTQALNYIAGTGPMRVSTAIYGRGNGTPTREPFSPLPDEDWKRRSQLETAKQAARKGAVGFRGVFHS